MGICTSAKENSSHPAQNPAQPQKSSSNQTNPQKQQRIVSADEAKVATKINQPAKAEVKNPVQIAKKSQLIAEKSDLAKGAIAASNEVNKVAAPIPHSNIDNGKINPPSWLSSSHTPNLIDGKNNVQHSHSKQEHNQFSHLKSLSKINQEIPPDPIPKEFHRSHSEDIHLSHTFSESGIRRVHQKGVVPIVQLPPHNQIDEQMEIKKQASVLQDVPVQPASTISGFIWQQRIGKVSIIH